MVDAYEMECGGMADAFKDAAVSTTGNSGTEPDDRGCQDFCVIVFNLRPEDIIK